MKKRILIADKLAARAVEALKQAGHQVHFEPSLKGETLIQALAQEKGIFVANCPGKNAAAVAELTIGLLIALDRRIPDNVFEIRLGHWNKAEFSKAKGLKGRTLGVINWVGKYRARGGKTGAGAGDACGRVEPFTH